MVFRLLVFLLFASNVVNGQQIDSLSNAFYQKVEMQHFAQARKTGSELVNLYRVQDQDDTNLANLLDYMSYTCHQLELP